MPIIHREVVKFKEAWFEKKTSYSSKTAKFRIEYPPEVGNFHKQRYVEAATEKEANEAFWHDVNEFLSATTKKDKVILYRFHWDSHIERDGKVVCENDFRLTLATMSSIKLEYEIACRFQVGQLESYFDMAGKKIWLADQKIMDWSSEREQFFHNVKYGMDELILRARLFMEMNPSKIAKMIDEGQKILLLEIKEK